VTAGTQLSFDGLDPYELAELFAHERGRLYDELGLDWAQRQAAEQAVRMVAANEYAREYEGGG
jgi:hypothetical protein